MNTIVKKVTENGKSYWDGNGAYQKEFDALYEELVPPSGEAKTVVGELVRSISRLTYEYYNNGNQNACNFIYEEVYDEEDEDNWYEDIVDTEVSKFYQYFIDFIDRHGKIDRSTLGRIREIIRDCPTDEPSSKYYFDESNEQVYAELCDEVMYNILSGKIEDRKL